MTYNNPVIPGFHPDPSVCRVGEDYYLVTSSFEYFPGIPLYHSRDLVHWEQIGHCLTRPDQVVLTGKHPNGMGVFAPTIRHHEGRFYVINTNVSPTGVKGGNFIVWTDDIRGEWSDPVWIDLPGIDPSLFFEDDKVYYTGTNETIFMCEIDVEKGAVLTPRKNIWSGIGGADPEAPHLYHIGEWYYLFISEGGTAQCHMLTVARSRSLEGPFEPCPRNPVLTNRSLPLPVRAIGHADLVEAHDGSWWAVCLGIRVVGYPDRHLLGRETFLVPMHWDEEGWPVMGKNGAVHLTMEADLLPQYPVPEIPARDDFDPARLGLVWNFIGCPDERSWSLESHPGCLALRGTAHAISEEEPVAWVGRRQEHLLFTARTGLKYAPQEGEEAGLTIYLNNQHHYDAVVTYQASRRVLQFRRQIGTLWKIEAQIELKVSEVELQVKGDTENYHFSYRTEGVWNELGRGEARYLSTEAGGRFTGAYVAMFASGGGARSETVACFDWFEYLPG